MVVNKEEQGKKIPGLGGIRKGGIIKEMGIRRHLDDDGLDADDELTGSLADGIGSDSDSTTGFGHDVNDFLPPSARTAAKDGKDEHDADDGAVTTTNDTNATEPSEKSSLDVGKGNYDGW